MQSRHFRHTQETTLCRYTLNEQKVFIGLNQGDTLKNAISAIDGPNGEGLSTPIIIFGYNLVHRSCSIRSDRRAITHMILAPGPNKPTSLVRQLMMRPNGYNCAIIRRNNGFDYVRVTNPLWCKGRHL